MEFVPVLAMLALVAKLVDFLRYGKAKDWNGVLTQAIVWVAGIVVVFLVAQTPWAAAIPFGSVALSKLGAWSLVFVGMSLSSVSSVGKDALKAVDNSNSAAIPTLLPAGPQRPRKSRAASTDVG